VHPMPHSGQDVPDDLDARLVVLGTDHAYSRESGNAAERAAKAILESRGNSPRLYRNSLVFLAADKTRLQDLDEAARKYLAWESILNEREQLDLSPFQVKQAETQKTAADSAVTARLPETYQWLLVPVQQNPKAAVEWQALKLSGQDALAQRASKKLRSEELLLTVFASTRLRMELDRVPLWRGDHVMVKQLVEDFARYLYLPRLKDSSVLLGAIQEGVGLLTWAQDSFAYADSYDDSSERYRGLRAGQVVLAMDPDASTMLVKPEVTHRQLDTEQKGSAIAGGEAPAPPEGESAGGDESSDKPDTPSTRLLTRYHGTVGLDATRVGRDAGRIAEEVIAHLTGLVGSSVTVTLEIHAEIPAGAPDHVVRTVTENSRTLKFTSQGFEEE